MSSEIVSLVMKQKPSEWSLDLPNGCTSKKPKTFKLSTKGGSIHITRVPLRRSIDHYQGRLIATDSHIQKPSEWSLDLPNGCTSKKPNTFQLSTKGGSIHITRVLLRRSIDHYQGRLIATDSHIQKPSEWSLDLPNGCTSKKPKTFKLSTKGGSIHITRAPLRRSIDHYQGGIIASLS